MDKKSIIGLVLIFGIFAGYMWWVSPSKEERAAMKAHNDSIIQVYNDSMAAVAYNDSVQATMAASGSGTNDSSSADVQTKTDQQKQLGVFACNIAPSVDTLSVSNQLFEVDLTNLGAAVNQVTINNYRTFDGLPLVLITPSDKNMNLVFSTNDNRIINTKDLSFTPYVNGQPVSANAQYKVGKDSLVVAYRAFAGAAVDSGAAVSKQENSYLEFRYTFYPNRYEVGFNIYFHGLSSIVRSTPSIDFVWTNSMNRQEKVDQSSRNSRNRNKDAEKFNSNIYYKPSNDKVDELRLGSDDDKKVKTPVEWVAFKQQFFCAILMSDKQFENADLVTKTNKEDTSLHYLCDMSSTIGLTYDSEKDCSMGMQFYYGPSKYRELRDMHKDFERMLPLGWGFFLTQWVSRFVIIPVFNFLEQFNWNYGIIIIVLTILLRLVLFPLTFKSYQSSAIMRILKPEMDALNKKFPNQDQALAKQQAMTALNKRAGINPLAGCLPMLIQMPILFAMFRFFPASIELRQQDFLWCNDLSTYDSILNFGFNIPLYGDHISLFCLLMFGVQFFYTWYTMKSQTAQANMPGMKLMMYFMPFMMLFLFNSQSAALNFYYFLSLSITMIQMVLIRQFTSEKKVRAHMAAYDAKHANAKPAKKSKFQQRMEEMQRMSEQMQKQQGRR